MDESLKGSFKYALIFTMKFSIRWCQNICLKMFLYNLLMSSAILLEMWWSCGELNISHANDIKHFWKDVSRTGNAWECPGMLRKLGVPPPPPFLIFLDIDLKSSSWNVYDMATTKQSIENKAKSIKQVIVTVFITLLVVLKHSDFTCYGQSIINSLLIFQ